MFLINLNAEIVDCILSFRKSRHKPNLENTSKYGFPPIWGGKWQRSERAHASYPGLFFRPRAGRKESSGTGLKMCKFNMFITACSWFSLIFDQTTMA